MPESRRLSALDTVGDGRPMVNQQGALAEEIPLAPFTVKKEHQHPSLNESQPLMWHISHFSITRDDYSTASRSKSLNPGHIVSLEVIAVAWLWRVLGGTCDLKRTDFPFQLPLTGKSLKDFDHCNGNVLVKRYFQAAFRSSCSNRTASRTCPSGTSKMSATNAALPSTFAD